jgi:predicted PurR-regulated permease PerM
MKANHFLLILLAGILIALVNIFEPFLKSILVAFLLSVATSSIHIYLKLKIQNNTLFASVMTIILAILFLAPFLYFVAKLGTYAGVINKTQLIEFFHYIKSQAIDLPDSFSFIKTLLLDILDKINIASVLHNILAFGASVGKNSASFLFDMLMILIFYFIFNFYAEELFIYIKSLIPLKNKDTENTFHEISNVTSIVFYSILATAIFEGILFGGFVYFFGYDGIMFGVLYGFASLIPIVGGIIMWLPLFAYEAFLGDFTTAIIIALYSILVISFFADTIIKPIIIKYINTKIVKTPTMVNELLIFFSIIAGLSTIGFWGMILGPAITEFFLTVLKLYEDRSRELKD